MLLSLRGGLNPTRIQPEVSSVDRARKGLLRAYQQLSLCGLWLWLVLLGASGLTSSARAEVSPSAADLALAERFIDPDHFQLGKRGLLPNGEPLPPGTPLTELYGADAFARWKQAAQWVEQQAAHRPPTADDLLTVHNMVYGAENASFESFWINRIGKLVPKGGPRNHALSLLRAKNYAELEKLTGATPPVGAWRDGSIAAKHRRGSSALPEDAYFTESEVQRLRENPHMRIHRARETSPGQWSLIYEFQPLGDGTAEPFVREAFATAQARLGQVAPPLGGGAEFDPAYQKEVTQTAWHLYHELAAIHGVWDGSGRTNKLMRDWLLQHHRLPVPRNTPVDDLLMTPQELAASTTVSPATPRRPFLNSPGCARPLTELAL